MAVQRSSAARAMAAPQREYPVRPNRHATVTPHLVPPSRPSRQTQAQHARQAALRAVKIIALSVCMLAMLSVLIYERAQLIELNTQRANFEDQLNIAKSETVRLEAQFNSRVSVDSVEEYAQKNLGMVKRQKYQVHFFKNENEDEILLLDPLQGE